MIKEIISIFSFVIVMFFLGVLSNFTSIDKKVFEISEKINSAKGTIHDNQKPNLKVVNKSYDNIKKGFVILEIEKEGKIETYKFDQNTTLLEALAIIGIRNILTIDDWYTIISNRTKIRL